MKKVNELTKDEIFSLAYNELGMNLAIECVCAVCGTPKEETGTYYYYQCQECQQLEHEDKNRITEE